VKIWRRFVVAISISGIDAKRFPFMVNFSFGKSQKSQGANRVNTADAGTE
jgi:hypothetical protein